ncbi:MAG: UDP-3-O-(3-hydroxymyristoyl)glucosamine N-acyltransferase [Elusimicrobia bacterium RIFOXYB2_FULL_62_6]|nr:MAG: UDP-3-O-(3-hydroxymyristoyl)glucosamine N-acyltransferase [Elusimicrobia bacterium RIFOXYB2_FULL_62_6]
MKITAGEIAALVGGKLQGPAGTVITGAMSLPAAGPSDLSFLEKAANAPWTVNRPAGCIIAPEDAAAALAGRSGAVIYVKTNPKQAFAQVLAKFEKDLNPLPKPGVHPSAVVDPAAKIGAGVHIGPHAVIEAAAEIGDNAVVSAGCYIGAEVSIGADSRLYPNVTVRERCSVGKNAIIHPGTVIGSDGYGYMQVAGVHRKIPQVGRVIIEDDVEIGANCAIDRAALDATVIGAGTKLDNLVHIAHNVRIGKNCLILAQAGIAGSTAIGNSVIIAGQAGISDHITIGDNAIVMAKTGIMTDLAPGKVVFGHTGRPRLLAMKIEVLLSKLPELFSTVRKLKKLLPADAQENDKE